MPADSADLIRDSNSITTGEDTDRPRADRDSTRDRPFDDASPEAELLVRCSIPPSMGVDSDRVRTLVGTDLSWDHVLDLGDRHGVIPLLHRNIEALGAHDVPDDVVARLRDRTRETTVRSLRYTDELHRLLDTFDEHGIRAIPFKGLVLAEFSYGDLSSRAFRDLDILVHRQDLSTAVDLLEARGYEWEHDAPRLDDAAILGGPFTLPLRCEYQLCRGDLTVEIRWQAGESGLPFDLDFETMWRRRGTVPIAGVEVPALDPADRLLTLAYHGTKHNWFLLKWVSDFAASLVSTDVDWSRLLDRARRHGVERKLLVSVALAISLFDIDVPKPIARRVDDDDSVTSLVSPLVASHTSGGPPERPSLTDRLWYNARAADSGRDVLRIVLRRQRLHPSIFEYQHLPLPGVLHPLYYPAVPIRLAAERLLKATRWIRRS